ncbi:hypothetical protein CCACVL1_17917 [Corchorus capsularis]|uniref:Uncharacterized protein n=1 Tax=Corchorus capsularis TaxID=210143 RepID=A0A1R3HPD8_COCAP|nr:hypothetical protein CCACVL1_17917 [Corchorus capsularis]
MSTRFSPWDLPMPYGSNHSNLQSFLQCITPSVPTRLLSPSSSSKKCNGSLEVPIVKNKVEGFTLGDLWHCYSEWSAYGAGVPILLNNGDGVVQYYTPSLSAFQIYTNKPFSSSKSRLNPVDGKFWKVENRAKPEDKDSCCDENKKDKIEKPLSNGSCLNSDNNSLGRKDQCGYLYCQYNEISSPYHRVPLKQKINELAKTYPGVLQFRSMDLSPYSWMAIAWYPLYQIPSARNVKELSACFLTYHPLSTLCQGTTDEMLEKENVEDMSCRGEERRSDKRKCEVSLPPFAAVAYKLSGSLWINPETSDQDSIICQQTAACCWLKQLQFQHHDFDFFMSHQF